MVTRIRDLGESTVQRLLHRCGLAVRRYPNPYDEPWVRQMVLKELQTTLVVDVGANVGQYAEELFAHSYKGRIVSLEPVREFFVELQNRCNSKKANRWRCHQLALGEENGMAIVHVASTMSSILDKSPSASLAVGFSTQHDETIEVARLDSIFDSFVVSEKESVWLKLDIQGYELCALRGASESLKAISAVELELSLWPFYKEQPDYREVIAYMEAQGFELASLAPNGRNLQTGRLLELNGIFTRNGRLSA
jgi:FkbM family methyltransferase